MHTCETCAHWRQTVTFENSPSLQPGLQVGACLAHGGETVAGYRCADYCCAHRPGAAPSPRDDEGKCPLCGT